MDHRLCKALRLRFLLYDLDFSLRQLVRLYYDNKTACNIAHNLALHDRTKHVEIDKFFIKNKLEIKL
jgi:hypothetical protein